MRIFIFLYLFGFSVSNSLYSQQSNANFSKGDYYKSFDDFIGNQNSDLVNGIKFIDKYKNNTNNNYRFYKSINFFNGFVIYNNQPYFDVEIKYDLLSDNIIIGYNDFTALILNHEMVDRFSIKTKNFVRLPLSDGLKSIYDHGFFEQAYIGKQCSLYKKYKKHKIKKVDNEQVFYIFKDRFFYVLKYKNKYVEINSKKDLLKFIPEYNKEIKYFYRTKKNSYGKSINEFMMNLAIYIDNI